MLAWIQPGGHLRVVVWSNDSKRLFHITLCIFLAKCTSEKIRVWRISTNNTGMEFNRIQVDFPAPIGICFVFFKLFSKSQKIKTKTLISHFTPCFLWKALGVLNAYWCSHQTKRVMEWRGGGTLDIFSSITKFLKLVIKIVIKNTWENNFSSSREVEWSLCWNIPSII